jgi:TatA/E family protein of Tat protein translocase
MAPGAFSPAHILIVLTVALVVLGPKELPKLVRGAAKAMRELRALRARLDEELHAILDDEEDGDVDLGAAKEEVHLGPAKEEVQPSPDA